MDLPEIRNKLISNYDASKELVSITKLLDVDKYDLQTSSILLLKRDSFSESLLKGQIKVDPGADLIATW